MGVLTGARSSESSRTAADNSAWLGVDRDGAPGVIGNGEGHGWARLDDLRSLVSMDGAGDDGDGWSELARVWTAVELSGEVGLLKIVGVRVRVWFIRCARTRQRWWTRRLGRTRAHLTGDDDGATKKLGSPVK